MSDIFSEIDEELRRDNLLKLWSRYRRHVIAVVGVVLVIAGGITAWRDYQLSQRRAQSARFASALTLIRDGKDVEAAKVFAAIAQESGGYAGLAAFGQAEMLAKTGDNKGAAAAYDRIAGADRDPAFRDVAVLLSVLSVLGFVAGLSRVAQGQPPRCREFERAGGDSLWHRPFDPRGLTGVSGVAPVDMPAGLELEVQASGEALSGIELRWGDHQLRRKMRCGVGGTGGLGGAGRGGGQVQRARHQQQAAKHQVG